MKDSRKKDIAKMAEAIEQPGPKKKGFPFERGMDEIQRKSVNPNDLSKADKIIATKKLEIPVCKQSPVNGRIYVVSVAGDDMKTPGGLILPPTFKAKKSEDVEGVRRYFVVAWDKEDIPATILSKLSVGIEVNPFIPQDAEGYMLPRVIDWNTGNIFEVLHYTELSGISDLLPEVVEK